MIFEVYYYERYSCDSICIVKPLKEGVKMSKVLSIIIPMYNSTPYIEKCLNSLLLPDTMMDKLDILVVNDGSTDGCEALVLGYVSEYPDSICLLNKANGGHGSAINYAVQYCRGKFFRVLDADDWFATRELAEFIDYLEHVGGADMVLSPYQTFDIQTSEYHLVRGCEEPGVFEMKELIAQCSCIKQICSLHALTYQTVFYQKYSKKIPEGVYYDDAFYSTIPAYRAGKTAISTLPVYVYRIGDVNQSVSSENRVKRMCQLETVIWELCKTYESDVLPCNQAYFHVRAGSAIADYLITACLRHPKRNEGRKLAHTFIVLLKKQLPSLFKYTYRKYIFLYWISIMGVSEQCLCLSMRKRARLTKLFSIIKNRKH